MFIGNNYNWEIKVLKGKFLCDLFIEKKIDRL